MTQLINASKNPSAAIAVAIALLTLSACATRSGPLLTTEDASTGVDAQTIDVERSDGAILVCTPTQVRCTSALPTEGGPRAGQGGIVHPRERCAEDGSGWEEAESCDAAAGEFCSGGDCIELGENPGCAVEDGSGFEGCRFWASAMSNPNNLGPMFMDIANPSEEPVWIQITGGALEQPWQQAVPPRTSTRISARADRELMVARETSDLFVNGAFRISASAPVAVTQVNQTSASTDGSALLAERDLGADYTVLLIAVDEVLDGPPTVTVVAPTATTVTVRSPVDLAPHEGRGIAAGVERTFEMAEGDLLQLLAADQKGDLTGMRIRATSNIAVFAGHGCYRIDDGAGGRTACDHLEEQLPPEVAWGRRYVVSGFVQPTMIDGMVRVLAARDNTEVTFEGASIPMQTLAAGEVFETPMEGPVVVSASEPILVMEVNGRRVDGVEDPSMVYSVPVEQFTPNSIFQTNGSFGENFATIIGLRGGTPIVNGEMVSEPEEPIADSEYSRWVVNLVPDEGRSSGVFRVGTAESTDPLGVIVFGYQAAGSYAYTSGVTFRRLQEPF